MRRLTIPGIAMALVLGGVGCTVHYTYLKSGYKDDVKGQIKRIALMVEPKASAVKGVDRALLGMQQEFLAVHSSYIVLPTPTVAQNQGGLEALCALNPAPQGVLKTEIRRLEVQSEGVVVGLRSVLLDCRGNRIWDAYGEDLIKSKVEDRPRLVEAYSSRYGGATKPLILPMYELLRQVLKSLPAPQLNSVEERERIRYFRMTSGKSADS